MIAKNENRVWSFYHNVMIHPMMWALKYPEWLNKVHDWTAKLAYPKRPVVQEADAVLINLNGIDCLVGARITFEEIASLASCSVDTITFSRGPLFQPQGILDPGESVWTKPGMVINATTTGKA